MIKKFDRNGDMVEFESAKILVGDSDTPIEMPILMTSPEQKYVGKWEPGKNHPTLTPETSGPLAGVVVYLPIPESQIQR